MVEQVFKNSLNFKTFNEGSFILDFKSKEIFLSQELLLILKDTTKKSYLVKDFFEKFIILDDYEEFTSNVYEKLENSDLDVFFENVRIRDKEGYIHEFTVKGNLYGDLDNLRAIGEIFEQKYYIGDRPILMTVLNAMPDSILILKENLIFFANKPAIKLCGYKEAIDIIGKDIFNYIRNDEFKQFMTNCASVLQLEEQFDEKIFDINDTEYDVDINVSKIENDLIMLTIRDISKRKTLEKEKLNDSDLILKMKSNLKVTQEKLISQEKMAGIGQLATGIVHEIFNPLGFVMSNFETLKTYFNDIKSMIEEINRNDEISKNKIVEIQDKYDIDFILEDINDLFSDVGEGIFRINGIIHNLKKFSRQEVDEFIEYDINEGIQSTLIIAKNEYKYIADIKTTLSKLPYTKANASKVNQVLLNLIVNASQAIKEKNSDERGLITINTFSDDEFIICEIIDTGIGMSPEVYEKIFEPFYTTKPVGVGTGLGLSISYDIITKQHGGSINIESEKGIGSKFIIKIPIVEYEND